MEIERVRGDTYSDSFLITNLVTGEVANITGCVAKLTLNTQRNPADESTQVYQLIGIIEAPETGVVEFAPDAIQSDLVGLYYFDIQLVDSDGIVRTPVKGVYKYIQDITKV